MTPSPQSDIDTEGNAHVRYQDLLTELSQRALETDDLDQLLNDATNAVVRALETEYASVLDLLPGERNFYLRDGVGWRDGLTESATLPNDPENHAGRALRSEEPVVVGERRAGDLFSGSELFSDHDVVSGIALVVGSVENPWGVLGTYATDGRDFANADIAFFRNVAGILGSAVDGMRSRDRHPEEIGDATDQITDKEQERIIRALETSGEGISLLDGDGEFIYVNEAYAEIYGYEPAEMLGEHWELLYPEGETEQIYTEVFPKLSETGTWAGETVGLRKDGSTLIEDHRLATTAGDEMVCTVRDATTEHEQRRQLEEQEAALRETYEVISDREKSFDEKIEALLKIGQTVIGTEAASLSHVDGDDYRFEVVRAPDESVQAGDVVPVSATNCERAIETEETLVLENVAEDAPELADRAGNTDWGISCYLGAPVLVDDDVYGTLCFYGETPREESFTDWQVTLVDLLSRWISYELERERHENALEQYREYTNKVLDAIDDVFYVLDESGELRRWNESLTEVTGYPDEEIESMHALEFFDGSDRDEIAEAISEGFETGQTRVEAAFRTRSGDAIPYEFVAVTLEDPDRDRILAGIGRDITRRREQERALQESNERLEQFAYAASHDL